ncbi:hypothetical protein FQN57_001064 [Myotisia sp. PD_48]|nr:hypothetical protein FQN57_001064 [Myotisia sp. PD_48]
MAPSPLVPVHAPTERSPQHLSSPIPPKAHVRSRSLAGSESAPSMTRAHSSPGLDSRGRYVFPASPSTAQNSYDLPLRRPSPLRVSVDSTGLAQQQSPAGSIGINISTEPISELPELQGSSSSSSSSSMISDPLVRAGTRSVSPSWSPLPLNNAFSRPSRRRPSSPLPPAATSNPAGQNTSSPSPSRPSPLVISSKFNEPYPSYSFSSTSSMPSTPSSIRSRSPSISSLETIPDIPDAEAAAIEADQIARLKAAADKADDADNSRRRNTTDPSGSLGPLGVPRFGLRADKRKRWSVCGAEGRQDLDLETIWED